VVSAELGAVGADSDVRPPTGRCRRGPVDESERVRKHLGDAFWLQTIVCGVIVLYLVQPDVQLAFGASKEYYDEYAPVESDSANASRS